MIKNFKGSLFDAPIDLAAHCCNIHNTFGAGVAAFIRRNFPEAYEADCETTKGDKTKLGMYSLAEVDNPIYPNIKYIANLYGQPVVSHFARAVSYDAFIEALEQLTKIEQVLGFAPRIGFPNLVASALAGGKWKVIHAMIEETFKDYSEDVIIAYRPEDNAEVIGKIWIN